jgi:hypothetical protein
VLETFTARVLSANVQFRQMIRVEPQNLLSLSQSLHAQ